MSLGSPKNFVDYGIELPTHAGVEVDAICPECSQTRKKKHAKCLSVNTEKGTWLCHHCGWSGGLAKGVERHEIHWRKPQYRRPEVKQSNLPEKALAWFGKRGICPEVLNRNRVGFTAVYMPQVEETVPAIVFPYFRDEVVVNAKYRDAHKNFRMEAGAERLLYGLNDLSETTIIVEGEIDKLSFEQAGFKNCVSVPDGAPPENAKDYASKFLFLDADKERIEAVKTWVIAVDNDPPGLRLEDELARRLGREKCKRVVWPQGCKDANEVLVKLGAGKLGECTNAAQPFPINGVFSVLDLSARVERLYVNGWERGVSTGWSNLDRYYTVRPGEFTVVTGIPNSGKSNWLDDICVGLAGREGWQFGVFSPENQPMEDHIARLLEKRTRKPFRQGPTERMTRQELDDAMQWAHQHFHLILPDDDDQWTIDNILESAKALVFRHGIRGLVIDPWNELEHHRPPHLSETEYIAQTLKRIRNFGRRHGVHVFVVAHPAKLYRDGDGNYPIPTMYDISGSAHWRNKADNGVCLWRDLADENTNVIQVHVQKVRFRQIGRIGTTDLVYNRVTATYHEPSKAASEIPPEHNTVYGP